MPTEEKKTPSMELRERMSALASALDEWAQRAGPEKAAYEAVAEAARKAANLTSEGK